MMRLLLPFFVLVGCSGNEGDADSSKKGSFVQFVESAGCKTLERCDYLVTVGTPSFIKIRPNAPEEGHGSWRSQEVYEDGLFVSGGERLGCIEEGRCEFVLIQGRWSDTFFLVYNVGRPNEGLLYNLHYNALSIVE